MSTDYRIDVLTAAGVKQAEVTDYLDLAYTRKVNAAGQITLTLPGDHAAIAELEHNGQVLVYRRNRAMALDWTADAWGFYRAQRRTSTDQELFTARCPGILSMLGWRHVGYYAGIANRSTFSAVAAETILKTLVSYNAGASATVVNGRVRAGVITGLSVEADGGAGNVVSLSCPWKNLLEVLQSICSPAGGVAGGDFDLVKTGAATWEFRWYTGQLGTDRTATVQFGLELGNMAEAQYEYDRTEERTVAIVAGQGEETARTVVIRTGADYAAANDVEVFVDARMDSTTAALNAAGDARLAAAQARQQLGFKVLQTASTFYGVHYGLGDLVTARYRSILATQKIVGVSVSVGQDGESVDVEMASV